MNELNVCSCFSLKCVKLFLRDVLMLGSHVWVGGGGSSLEGVLPPSD